MDVNSIKQKLLLVKLRFYYRMWKTRLSKYGGYDKRSALRILDVGCGKGYFLKCLEKWFPFAELYGIDISKDKLKYASEMLKKS